MSVSTTRLGTTNLTYSHNPDRSGVWATYLMDLSHQNGLDRQKVNGELNYNTGAVHGKASTSKKPKGKKGGGGGAKGPKVKVSNTVIANHPSESLLAYYRRIGYNPRYLEGEA